MSSEVSDILELKGNYDEDQIKQMNDLCIETDYDDNIIGSVSKFECHLMRNINKGMVHRALSVLIFNENNEFLLTQRSMEKITFPGVYTNTVCSHPLYCETEMDGIRGAQKAAQRRVMFELGVNVEDVPLHDFQFMTRFHYTASSNDTWGENEISYVFIVHKNVRINPNPNEVMSAKYYSKNQLDLFINANRKQLTPWFSFVFDAFLYNWWNNLDNLDKYRNEKTIHRF
ncbi:Isopentenyl-diphosphate Delta-isomerase 1-like protein [Leptotrombidium deliense]|uniref:isopentenyl-diphosphate Delta-isomerase n=1 Tax=Leptotrombidium deliense TaxID=299467 RepID=A0A443S015_9ACAR|nr:Isopentenyl-diphosphate Delta-isomerase 1-like protein [Leptotrombidium deliense]